MHKECRGDHMPPVYSIWRPIPGRKSVKYKVYIIANQNIGAMRKNLRI